MVPLPGALACNSLYANCMCTSFLLETCRAQLDSNYYLSFLNCWMLIQLAQLLFIILKLLDVAQLAQLDSNYYLSFLNCWMLIQLAQLLFIILILLDAQLDSNYYLSFLNCWMLTIRQQLLFIILKLLDVDN